MSNDTLKNIQRYFSTYYLPLSELAIQAQLTLNDIEALISAGCIPSHSHTVSSQWNFHTMVFGNATLVEEMRLFNASVLQWIKRAKKYNEIYSLNETAERIKTDFKNELCTALLEINYAKEVFPDCFADENTLSEPCVKELMQNEWPYILNGTYGVCLKVISAKSLIRKLFSVSLMQRLIDTPVNQLSDADRRKLLYALKLYEETAADFAPHELEKSSRKKLYLQWRDRLNK